MKKACCTGILALLLASLVCLPRPLAAETTHWEQLILRAKAKIAVGEYVEARAILEAALRQANQSGNAAALAATASNLACVDVHLGRYAEAEQFAKRALAVSDKILGRDHADVAIDLNNLAGAYYSQGRYDRAEALFARALRIDLKVLGPDHPETINVQRNIGPVYVAMGKYAQAEEHLLAAITAIGRAIPAESPEAADALSNLATLRYAQRRYPESGALLEQALSVWNGNSAAPRLSKAIIEANLATIYAALGRWSEAESLFQRSVPVIEAENSDNPGLPRIMLEYAHWLRQAKHRVEARRIEEHARGLIMGTESRNPTLRHTIDVRALR